MWPIGSLHIIVYPYQVFAWVYYKQTLHNLLREVALGVSSAMKILQVYYKNLNALTTVGISPTFDSSVGRAEDCSL